MTRIRRIKKKKANPKVPNAVQIPPSQTVNQNNPKSGKLWERIKKIGIKGYFILGILITLITAYFLNYQIIDEFFTSKEEAFNKKNFIKGIHIPLELNKSVGYVIVRVGGCSSFISFSQLNKGHVCNIKNDFSDINVEVKMVNGYIFTSIPFRDIKSGNLIGKMDFNKWQLKTNAIYNFHDSDDNMEVIDANGYVVFRMRYDLSINTIIINGYIFNNDKVIVIKDSATVYFGINDKMEAIKEIESITPINNY